MLDRPTRSERLTILVTPEEKKAIGERAAAMNTTASEVLRLAFDAYEDPQFTAEEEQVLRELAAGLNDSVDATVAKLDGVIAESRATLAALREGRRAREPA